MRCLSAWREALGYSPESLVGRRVADIVHPDDVPILDRTAQRARDTGAAEPAEIRVRRRDGEDRLLEWSTSIDALMACMASAG